MRKNADILAFSAVGIAFLCLGGYFAYPHLAAVIDPKAALVAACEGELKDRLKAPSTYRLIDEPLFSVEQVSPEEAAGPIPDYADDAHREVIERIRKSYEPHAYRHRVYLKYEAANAYGTPLADVSTCDFISRSEDPPAADDLRFSSSIRIDGQTNLERSIDAVRTFGQ